MLPRRLRFEREFGTELGVSYKDREKQREYQRRWLRRKRQGYVQRAGGRCIHCTSKRQLEFDHVDPKQKQYAVSSLWSRRKEIIEQELAKCQLLCERCHKKKTVEENGWKQHGTFVHYSKNGCRCALCRRANRDHQRTIRAGIRVGRGPNTKGCKRV